MFFHQALDFPLERELGVSHQSLCACAYTSLFNIHLLTFTHCTVINASRFQINEYSQIPYHCRYHYSLQHHFCPWSEMNLNVIICTGHHSYLQCWLLWKNLYESWHRNSYWNKHPIISTKHTKIVTSEFIRLSVPINVHLDWLKTKIWYNWFVKIGVHHSSRCPIRKWSEFR